MNTINKTNKINRIRKTSKLRKLSKKLSKLRKLSKKLSKLRKLSKKLSKLRKLSKKLSKLSRKLSKKPSKKKYDYVIVGGGISGLTLALYLAKNGKKVALIDKNKTLGGCHRVKRINGLFSEHGPRIYSSNYLMFIKVLKEIGLDFYSIFTPYKFGILNIGGLFTNHVSPAEIAIIIHHLLGLSESYKTVSVKQFLLTNKFSISATDYIDRLCRLTDGASIESYSLYNFLQLINQNSLGQIFQPKKPNDVVLFPAWENKLKSLGVDIYIGTYFKNLNMKLSKKTGLNNITSISTSVYDPLTHDIIDNKIFGSNFILAMPPYTISQILSKSTATNTNIGSNILANAFGPLKQFTKWSTDTNYLEYIPIIFHWDKKLNLEKVWGFPSTSWGVGFIVLSDYMEFNDPRSKTVISTIITKHAKSDFTKKTPNETSDKNELMREVFRQLKTSFDRKSFSLPQPSFSLISENYYDKEKEKWIPIDTAFIVNANTTDTIPYKSSTINNLFNCGTQNGNSIYSFTSAESAVSNAFGLLEYFDRTDKASKTGKLTNRYKIEGSFTVSELIVVILIFITYFIVIKPFSRK